MHAHDNCWRCGKWFSFGPYHKYGDCSNQGMLGLCESCWDDLRFMTLFLVGLGSFLVFLVGAISGIHVLWTIPVLYVLAWVIYGGIRLVQHLDSEGWFNFVDRIREKHLEPWEKDK